MTFRLSQGFGGQVCGFDTVYTHAVNNYSSFAEATADGSATGLGPNSAPIVSAGQVGSSTGSILYYSETKNWLNGPASPYYNAPNANGVGGPDFAYADAYTRYSYVFYEAEVQAQVKLINRDAPAGVDSNFTYDGLGRLSNVSVGGPRAHTLNYTNDINGQVISRSVTGGPGTAKPVQYYHYYNGIMLGANGNNGNDRPDHATALNERIAQGPTTPGIFRNGGTGPNPYADFDQAYDAVSPETLGQGPSAYTVRNGDSLESIAAQVWGDASLWYMLAEANPSASRGTLTAGTSLIIPNKVANFHNTSDTFRPYDAERAIGDTQPGTPKPPKAKKGCGAIGAILIAVIAIAVTAIVTAGIGAIATGASFSSSFSAVLGGSLAGLTGTAAGATALGTAGAVGAGVLGAITGSAISQAFGVATGLQDKFSWKGVALAGLTAGIGGGLDGLNVFSSLGVAGTQGANGVFNAVVRAAITNTVTQGVAVATKLQDKFSFTSVAAAGVAAGVASVVSQNIGGAAKYENGKLTDSATKLNRLISGVAATIAGGATRSAIDGTNFGDNIIATLPDVVASLLSYGLEDIADGDGKPTNLLPPGMYDENAKSSASPLPDAGEIGNDNSAANAATQDTIESSTTEGAARANAAQASASSAETVSTPSKKRTLAELRKKAQVIVGPAETEEPAANASSSASSGGTVDPSALTAGIGSGTTQYQASDFSTADEAIDSLNRNLDRMNEYGPDLWGTNDLPVVAKFLHFIASKGDTQMSGEKLDLLGSRLDRLVAHMSFIRDGGEIGAARLGAALAENQGGYNFDTTLELLNIMSDRFDASHQNTFKNARDTAFSYVAFSKGYPKAVLWSAVTAAPEVGNGIAATLQGVVELFKLGGDILASPFSSNARQRLSQRWENLTVENVFGPIANGFDQALLYDDFRPFIRGVSEAVSGAVFAEATMVAGRVVLGAARAAGWQKRILEIPKGERPDPASYLSLETIEAHSTAFAYGASRFTTKRNLDRYGIGREDGTSFVMTKADADALVGRAGGHADVFERELGLEPGTLSDSPLVRIDIPDPQKFNIRIPSGNEAGANQFWLPGGRTPNGNWEGIVDIGDMKKSQWRSTGIKTR